MAAVRINDDPLQPLMLFNRPCYYKSEGNANIVIGMPDDGTIVRVIKCNSKYRNAQKFTTLHVQLDFCHLIQEMFFGDYMEVPTLTSASVEELRELNSLILPLRPANRIHLSIWWIGGTVTICTDFTLLPPTVAKVGPVYCVEIKPKQGWIHDDDKTCLNIDGKCLFCLQQFLKVKQLGGPFSRYCPMDLFSGDRQRVEHSIQQLLITPQNNLKIFRDGHQVQWAECGTAFEGRDRWLARFVAAALLGDFDKTNGIEELSVPSRQNRNEERSVDPRSRLCNFESVPMPMHCVLDKILTMQKLQTSSFNDVCATFKTFPDSMLRNQFGHVDRLMEAAKDDASTVPVDNYLMAATARDCSMFVTFGQMTEESGDCDTATVRFDDCRYAVCVKIGDVDPKPLVTIHNHMKRNANILEAYNSFFTRPQAVIDLEIAS